MRNIYTLLLSHRCHVCAHVVQSITDKFRCPCHARLRGRSIHWGSAMLWWYDDILYRCIVFSISYFVDALIIKMEIWLSLYHWEAIRKETNTNAAWWRSQDATFLLFQWSRWRPLDFLVQRANASFNMMIALLLIFFVGFLCNRLGHVVKLARRCSCSQ